MVKSDSRESNYSFEDDYFQPIVELYLRSLHLYKKFFNAESFNITPQQWTALNKLWQEDGIAQAQLAKRTFKDYTYTTRLVDDLEKKKLVRRVRDKRDRRVNKVFLTDAGVKFKFKIYKSYKKISESLRSGISDSELENLKKSCGKLLVNYRTYEIEI
jgi:DNA-binding MarR family transcriptional regulator